MEPSPRAPDPAARDGGGRVLVAGRDAGAGVAVGPRLVVTAGHVVRNWQPGVPVAFRVLDGPAVDVVPPVRPAAGLDAAALDLAGDVAWQQAARAGAGDRWWANRTGAPNDPVLTGTVTATGLPLLEAAGNRVTVMQLHVDQDLGGFGGYSGSAVRNERGQVTGLLIEEKPQRLSERRPLASNVLFALPIAAVAGALGIDIVLGAPGPAPLRPPGLPHGLVTRDGLADQVVAALLARPDPVVALAGMGGFGKSVLAGQVASRPEISARWPGGVLWLQVGQQPDLAAILATAYADLTGNGAGRHSAPYLADWLGQELASRRALLVLDDVWDGRAIEPLLRATGSLPRLLTTRNRVMLEAWDVAWVPVGELEPDEAVQLLSVRLGRPGSDVVLAGPAGRLGRWPLLISLAAGYLRRRADQGASLDDALAALTARYASRGVTAFDDRRAAAAASPADRALAVELTVEASLHLLEAADRECYRELAVFPQGVPVPFAAVAGLWPDLEVFDLEDLLGRLAALSLLTVDYGRAEIGVHDLLHAYLAHRVGREGLAVLHDRVVAGWGSPSGLTEPYQVLWYAYHLAAAGRGGDLYALITPSWRDRVLAVTGTLSPAARDVQRAADYAAAHDDLAEEVRCHLILARLTRDASELPVAVLRALARLGDLDRALDRAALLPADQREDALAEILAAYASCDPDAAQTLAEARLADPAARAEAFAGIALAVAARDRARARALTERAVADADRVTDGGRRASVLLSVAGAAAVADPALAESLAGRAEHPRVVSDLRLPPAESWRQSALVAVVGGIAATDPARAEALAARLTHPQARVTALAALVAVLNAVNPDRARSLAREAAGLADTMTNPGTKALMLARMAGAGTDQAGAFARRAVDAVADADGPYAKETQAGTAVALAGSYPDLAEELAQRISEADYLGAQRKAWALAEIAQTIAGKDRDRASALVEQALALAGGADYLAEDFEAVCGVAAGLARADLVQFRRLVDKAAGLVGRLRGGYSRSRVLAEIVAVITRVAAADAELLARAEELAGAIDWPPLQAETHALLAEAVAGTDIGHAVTLAARMADPNTPRRRAELLARLTVLMAATDPAGAERCARLVDDADLRARAFAAVAARLAGHDIERASLLLGEAEFRFADADDDQVLGLVAAFAAVDVPRAIGLAARLGPVAVPPALAQIALVDRAAAESAARDIVAPVLIPLTLDAIAAKVAEQAAASDGDLALAMASEIADEEARARAFAAISALMAPGQGAIRAASAALELADRNPDMVVYAALVPVLARVDASWAAAVALRIRDDEERAAALARVAALDPRAALAASDRISEPHEKWVALAAIAAVTGELDLARAAEAAAGLHDWRGRYDDAIARIAEADARLALRVVDADPDPAFRMEGLAIIAESAAGMPADLVESILGRVSDPDARQQLGFIIAVAASRRGPEGTALAGLRGLLPRTRGNPGECWAVVHAMAEAIRQPATAEALAGAVYAAVDW